MELKLKKRIVGVTLLVAMGLIIIPMFFGHSVSTDELKLSGHTPHPPALPVGLTAPMPPRDATVPAIATQSKAPAVNSTMAGGIVFEQLESVAPPSVEAGHSEGGHVTATPQPTSTPAAPVTEGGHATTLPASSPAKSVTEPTAISANPEEPSVLPEVAIVPAPEKEAKLVAKAKKAKPVSTVAAVQKNNKDANTVANPESWALQLGSFSDKINASNLMKKLQDAGFSAYMHDSKTAQGNLIRVLVGPQLHRSDAGKIQKQLQQQFSLKSIIVKVSP